MQRDLPDASPGCAIRGIPTWFDIIPNVNWVNPITLFLAYLHRLFFELRMLIFCTRGMPRDQRHPLPTGTKMWNNWSFLIWNPLARISHLFSLLKPEDRFSTSVSDQKEARILRLLAVGRAPLAEETLVGGQIQACSRKVVRNTGLIFSLLSRPNGLLLFAIHANHALRTISILDLSTQWL